jgi:hypothetical protein
VSQLATAPRSGAASPHQRGSPVRDDRVAAPWRDARRVSAPRSPPASVPRRVRRSATVAGCGWPRSRSRSPRSALPWRLRGSACRRSGAGMIGRRASSQQATPSPPRARPSLLNHEPGGESPRGLPRPASKRPATCSVNRESSSPVPDHSPGAGAPRPKGRAPAAQTTGAGCRRSKARFLRLESPQSSPTCSRRTRFRPTPDGAAKREAQQQRPPRSNAPATG